MNSFIHVGGLDIQYDDKDEDPSCIEQLKTWIQAKKLEYKDKYILKQANSVVNNNKYEDELKKLGITLIKAFENDTFDENILKENGWPPELIECMNDSAVFIPVTDSIEVSFIQFPNTPSLDHAKLLDAEMKKTATE